MRTLFLFLLFTTAHFSWAEVPSSLKRCELVPLPGQQVSFQIDGVEQTRWHFDRQAPRPFFFPFNGPSGSLLTRMGHPGAAIFGKPARWVDYSGPVAVGSGPDRRTVVEGITYFDHPDNPRYPTCWHVREDGWMGAAFSMNETDTITSGAPLCLRYLLHAHSGAYDHARAKTIHDAFSKRPKFRIMKSSQKHRQYEVVRISTICGKRLQRE